MSAAAAIPVPRRVSYDWDGVPVHWVPGDAGATHVMNTLHLFLPAGERWFVRVFKQALPYLEDDEVLQAQARAFMSQEGMHATAHDTARAHLEARGFDTAAYVAVLDRVFGGLLGDHALPPRLQLEWLRTRLAAIAAIEHYTAVLGHWVLQQDALAEAGTDPTMLGLLQWHGAEEVEHRAVAFDVFQHVCGSYVRRATVAQLVFPILTGLVWAGTRELLDDDPYVHHRRFWRSYRRSAAKGRLPTTWSLFREGPAYLRPDYHPSHTGDLDLALAHLAG